MENSTFIKANNKLFKKIPVSTGIRHLSPIPFDVLKNKIINAKNRYKMGTKEFTILCFADDAVIISENNLQR